MKIRTTLIAALALAAVIVYAAGRNPVDIPDPKYTVSEAIRMVEARAKATDGVLHLISVDWCRGDQYEAPRWISGSGSRDDKIWSWFICYARRGHQKKSFEDDHLSTVRQWRGRRLHSTTHLTICCEPGHRAAVFEVLASPSLNSWL
jgi:hypothetical protein